MPVPTDTAFETVIGLEVHAQLLTRSKMYCGCSAEYADAHPNTQVCAVCAGLPGALPVANRRAVEICVLTGLALDCEIPGHSKLDRKNYVYPDLPKGYQISQYDLPLCVNGSLAFVSGGRDRRCGITRVHIEEDTGRLMHVEDGSGRNISLVDLNRSGVPLMEIVGEPELRSPAEARDYLIALRQILRYIGASTGNMEEGAFRCDANISTRSIDGSLVGSKVEIKNMNSFRAVERALRYEEERQRSALLRKESVEQETRGWVDGRGMTVSQRTKERAHDYRYFPEPDLPPLAVDRSQIADILATMPELPAERRRRFVANYGISAADAGVLTEDRAIADYFEEAIGAEPNLTGARTTANWIVNDLFGLQRDRGLPSDRLPLSVAQLRDLLDAIDGNELTGRAAKELLPQIGEKEMPRSAAVRLNLLSLNDEEALRSAAVAAMEAFPQAVEDFQAGKTAAIGRLIGETIRRTGGRARPDTVRQLLEDMLRES